MIVKLIFLVLAVWLGYKIYQAYRKISSQSTPPEITQNMVRCEKCGVHLPASEALKSGSMYYCSKDHLPMSDQ